MAVKQAGDKSVTVNLVKDSMARLLHDDKISPNPATRKRHDPGMLRYLISREVKRLTRHLEKGGD